MARAWLSRTPLLAALLVVARMTSTTSAASIPVDSLFARAPTCSKSGYSPCGTSNLPDDFCCSSDSSCMLLAGNTTVLCCPSGHDCSRITPIPCDLGLQDAKLHPESQIKTTALTGALGHCGDGTCCPFGYSCDTNGNCAKDANQNVAPLTSVPVSSTAAASQATTASTAQATATNSGASKSTPNAASQSSDVVNPTDASSSGSGSTTPYIVGGVIGGVLLLILLGVVGYCFYTRRRAASDASSVLSGKDGHKLTRSTSSFGNIISAPIASPSAVQRTDFNRKSPRPNSNGSTTLNNADGRSSVRSSHYPTENERTGGFAPGYDPHATMPPMPSAGDSPRAGSRQQQRARQSSIAYGYGGGSSDAAPSPIKNPYNPYDGNRATEGIAGAVSPLRLKPRTGAQAQQQSRLVREPSTASIPIAMAPPGRRDSTQTTFTQIMQGASSPSVPSPKGPPSSGGRRG